MAWREWRAHPAMLAFLSASVGIGVAVLIGTGALSAAMGSSLQAEGRTLLGGDLEARSHNPFPAALEAELARLRAGGTEILRTVEMLSMVSSATTSSVRLCSLKAVEPGYPLYGELATHPPEAAASFGRGPGLLLAPALALQLGVKPGDRLKTGRSTLPVLGELATEPDTVAEPFRLGPRLLMRMADLPATGLLAPGSRATYRALLRLPGETAPEAVETRFKAIVGDRGDVDVTTATQGPETTRRLVGRLRMFLELAGLCMLLLACIGTAAAIHTYVQQRLDSLAVLRCLGLTGPRLLGMLLFQTFAVALAGCVPGILGGLALAHGLPALLAGVLPFELHASPSPAVLAQAVATALAMTITFALLPLWRLRGLPAARIFRRGVETDERPGAADRTARRAALALAVCSALLVWWPQGENSPTMQFLAGFGAAIAGLLLSARLALHLLRALPTARRFELRHALANLHRPGNQSTSVVVAIGLGVFLTLSMRLLGESMLDEIDTGTKQSAPNVFIIDIQPDQAAGVTGLLAGRGHPAEELVPLVRSRLERVAGRTIRSLYPDLSTAPWWVTRDYWVTYRSRFGDAEELLEGRLWTGPAAPGATPEISLEERTAERLGVGVGDNLSLDVQGLEVTATITSIRRVRWTSMRPNFFIMFQPGVLERAPHTYFAVTRVAEMAQRVELTRSLVQLHPNLTIIDFTDAAGMVRRVLDRIGWAVWLVAGLCLGGGGLVLGASVLLTRRHRLHEMALLKLLGAGRPRLLRILATEYALLGALAGTVGCAAALLVTRLLASQLFEVTIPAPLASAALAVLLTAGFVTACGALASLGLLSPPPSQILRAE
jgi:putative ABC transport system permease protein